jgi:hypothetical protein
MTLFKNKKQDFWWYVKELYPYLLAGKNEYLQTFLDLYSCNGYIIIINCADIWFLYFVENQLILNQINSA